KAAKFHFIFLHRGVAHTYVDILAKRFVVVKTNPTRRDLDSRPVAHARQVVVCKTCRQLRFKARALVAFGLELLSNKSSVFGKKKNAASELNLRRQLRNLIETHQYSFAIT